MRNSKMTALVGLILLGTSWILFSSPTNELMKTSPPDSALGLWMVATALFGIGTALLSAACDRFGEERVHPKVPMGETVTVLARFSKKNADTTEVMLLDVLLSDGRDSRITEADFENHEIAKTVVPGTRLLRSVRGLIVRPEQPELAAVKTDAAVA